MSPLSMFRINRLPIIVSLWGEAVAHGKFLYHCIIGRITNTMIHLPFPRICTEKFSNFLTPLYQAGVNQCS